MLEFKPLRVTFDEVTRKAVEVPENEDLDVNIQIGISLADEVTIPYRVGVTYEAISSNRGDLPNEVILRVVANCIGVLEDSGEPANEGVALDDDTTSRISRRAVKFVHPQISLLTRQLDPIISGSVFSLPPAYPPKLKREDMRE